MSKIIKKRPVEDDGPLSTTKTAKTEASTRVQSLFDAPPPPAVKKCAPPRLNAGSTQLSKIEGLVTRVSEEQSKGRGGADTIKTRLNILVTNVIGNGALDFIRTSQFGHAYLLPTMVVDTPETAEMKFKPRALAQDVRLPVRALGSVSLSFFPQNQTGADNTIKNASPGSFIEVSGMVAEAKNAPNVYLNNGSNAKVTPLKGVNNQSASAANVTNRFIAEFSSAEFQAHSAFLMSSACAGFFNEDVESLTDAQLLQINKVQALWASLKQEVLDKIAALKAKSDDDANVVLNKHAARIEGLELGKIASGEMPLFEKVSYDKSVAPIVQYGLQAWNRVPQLIKDLGAGKTAALPKTFFAPRFQNVEVVNTECVFEIAGAFVFDATSASTAIAEGNSLADVMLSKPSALISVKISMRDMARRLGNMSKTKSSLGVVELVPTMTCALLPIVGAPDGSSMSKEWTELTAIDMPTTIMAASVMVSEAFIKTMICDGNNVFVHETASEADVFTMIEGNDKLPSFGTEGYQELTASSWKFAMFKTPRTYRVVFEGVSEALAAPDKKKPKAAKDTEVGEELLAEAASSAGYADVKSFITEACLVYVVAATD